MQQCGPCQCKCKNVKQWSRHSWFFLPSLAQSRQQQQNVEDAIKEMQKPLARYIDDEDLDQMLREQEREGDPMANFIRKNKAKENKNKRGKPGGLGGGGGDLREENQQGEDAYVHTMCTEGVPMQSQISGIWEFRFNPVEIAV